MKLFAVVGSPISHSLSPGMFNAALEHCSIEAHYTRIACDGADEALGLFRKLGLSGMNVTSPLKETIALLVDPDGPAARLGAVNTVVTENGRMIGRNTDVIGVHRALSAGGIEIGRKKAVVLGAGGAGKAAAYALKHAGAAEVVLVNRTLEKARAFADGIGCRAAPMDDLGVELQAAGLFISCLPVHLPVDPSWLGKDLVVMDANYRSSSLEAAAREAGCRVVSGLDWLLFQAAETFERMTGRKAPETVMKAALARKPVHRSNIALVGFMGAGKTAVGRHLADALGWRHIDTDRAIETRIKTSVADIIRQRGEPEFRILEKAVLAESLCQNRAVLSCGGGIVLDAENRRLLRRNATVVWLWASADTALARVPPGTRPLLETGRAQERAEEILAERMPHYARTADFIVSGEVGGAADVAKAIASEYVDFSR